MKNTVTKRDLFNFAEKLADCLEEAANKMEAIEGILKGDLELADIGKGDVDTDVVEDDTDVTEVEDEDITTEEPVAEETDVVEETEEPSAEEEEETFSVKPTKTKKITNFANANDRYQTVKEFLNGMY